MWSSLFQSTASLSGKNMIWPLNQCWFRKGCSPLEVIDRVHWGQIPQVIHMESEACMCLFPGPWNLLSQGALSSETLPTVVLSRWWVFLYFMEWWGLRKQQDRALMDGVEWTLVFQGIIQKPFMRLCDWYLHIELCALTDVATLSWSRFSQRKLVNLGWTSQHQIAQADIALSVPPTFSWNMFRAYLKFRPVDGHNTQEMGTNFSVFCLLWNFRIFPLAIISVQVYIFTKM